MRANRGLTGLGVVLGVACCAVAAAQGCSSGGGGSTARGGDGGPKAAAGPAITGVTVTANPNNVLSATVTFTTSAPATDSAVLQNTSPGGSLNKVTAPGSTTPVTSHSIDLLGMRASSDFTITVSATGADGGTSTATGKFTTPSLPPILPTINVLSNPTPTPGWTLLDVWGWSGMPEAGANTNAVVILDSELQIVWYFLPTPSFQVVYPNLSPDTARRLDNGHLYLLTGGGWAEIDMMGNLIQAHKASDLGNLDLNHEINQVPDGGPLLSLTPQLETVKGYPDGGGPYTYNVVGSLITSLGLDGGVLNQWSEFNMLSPYVEGSVNQFNSDYWDTKYPKADGGTKDWTHDNAVGTNPNDGNLVVSSRTQSLVYEFAPGADGGTQVLWALGPPPEGTFTLPHAGDTFQYNQHAGYVLPGSGDVMCFDDGTARPDSSGNQCGFSTGQTPCYSRAVEFALDTSAKTASVVWQFQGTPSFYSQDLGSSYLLDSGNVLVDSGGEVCNGTCDTSNPGTANDYSGIQQSAQDEKHGEVWEVTHALGQAPTIVSHFEIKQATLPGVANFSGFSIYRAYRLPSLY